VTVLRALLLAVIVIATPEIAIGGDYHLDVFRAVVAAKRTVDGYTLGELWITEKELGGSREVEIVVSERSCELNLTIKNRFFEKLNPIIVYLDEDMCESYAVGEDVRIQYFGLANDFRVISIEKNQKWLALERMRESVDNRVRDCFKSRESKLFSGCEWIVRLKK
jgi:hypothetical protein